MKDKHEKTILAHLVRIEERLDRIDESLHDLKKRQTLTEESVANQARAHAGLQARLDGIDGRLDRMEGRIARLGTSS